MFPSSIPCMRPRSGMIIFDRLVMAIATRSTKSLIVGDFVQILIKTDENSSWKLYFTDWFCERDSKYSVSQDEMLDSISSERTRTYVKCYRLWIFHIVQWIISCIEWVSISDRIFVRETRSSSVDFFPQEENLGRKAKQIRMPTEC